MFNDVPVDNGTVLFPGILLECIEGDKPSFKTAHPNSLTDDGGIGKRYEYEGPPMSLAQVLLA